MGPAGKRRVLIVDDDPGIRHLLLAFMRCRGFDLLEARNGREALTAMHSGNADVVVMDLLMPEVSGWDVLRERESDAALRQIPMIVVTANDVAKTEIQVAGQHVWAVIGKPFDLDELMSSVTGCLDPRANTPVAA